jgi:hypothetical protein
LALTGPATYLKLDADGQHVDIWNSTTDSGTPSQSLLLSQISSMSVAGSTANDSLTIDFSAGDPLVPTGLSFDGGAGGQNSLNIVGTAGNDSVSVGASTILFGSVPITYADTTAITFSGGAGSDSLTQTAQPGGWASLIFSGTTAADTLTVNAGTFTFPAAPLNSGITAELLNSISIGSNATVALAAPATHADRSVLVLNTLSMAINGPYWQGKLDLSGNDMIVQSGSLATITNQISSGYQSGTWAGKGIISSAAANDSTRLTTLGVLLNDDGSGDPIYYDGVAQGPFDGQSPPITAVLVKYTYFGDANLDGVVNGDDYTLIDNGFNSQLTGWINGDFDYNNSVNASDYLQIDNAFNAAPQSLSVVANIAPAQITLAINSFSTTMATDFDADDLLDKRDLHPGLWAIL